ncbi:hypothetical protein [Taklimakanibacter albus]|uniref:Uncharacterized protein n=1 Tax=Taklimakanibacter albus TaxID=2800327 RepID=A0ACC5R6T3_9HYPH|nr:hypothetical protein [Aestuariivirga sp. YIM B02566]MBK1868277.1 hypothetical protein [Aestuariivirga sp. YIM B02566]
MSPTITMRELIAHFDAADASGKPAREQFVEVRRAQFERAQANGRVVMLDEKQIYDPEEPLLMALVASTCGHLVRVGITAQEAAAIYRFARSQGLVQ